MTIRKAEEKDIPAILRLLGQVLELHAAIRPDIFVSGATKYGEEELIDILKNEKRLSYAALGEDGEVIGYALCEIKETPPVPTMKRFRTLFIDDLCVDEDKRGVGVGTALFGFVREEAKKLGCYEILLNVWEGNDAARAFYDRMGMKPKETRMELIL